MMAIRVKWVNRPIGCFYGITHFTVCALESQDSQGRQHWTMNPHSWVCAVSKRCTHNAAPATYQPVVKAVTHAKHAWKMLHWAKATADSIPLVPTRNSNACSNILNCYIKFITELFWLILSIFTMRMSVTKEYWKNTYSDL